MYTHQLIIDSKQEKEESEWEKREREREFWVFFAPCFVELPKMMAFKVSVFDGYVSNSFN